MATSTSTAACSSQELMENDLVDEIHLMVFPVLLGTGRRPVRGVERPQDDTARGLEAVGDGVAILTYERA